MKIIEIIQKIVQDSNCRLVKRTTDFTNELALPTSKRLYPEDDVIWEELEGDISNEWYLIAESEQINQYISIDLSDSHLGYCYDSFLETHATPGESQIIAKSFTELLEHLYASKGENWFWLADNFESYGDAYDGR